jgi:Proprotein convertase P-domain
MQRRPFGRIGIAISLILFLAASGSQAAEPQVMRVVGRQLLDSSGAPFLARGIEGWFGPNAQANMPTLVDGIASQGFNAVRLQLLTSDLGKIEPLIQRFHSKGMVVYLTNDNMPGNGGDDWYGRVDVKAMIERHPFNLVIDATIEEGGDGDSNADVAAWLLDQKDVITLFRGWGYTQPLTIGTPNAGRYLRALLDHGQELIDHDPLHSLVLNAQMYWGAYSSGWSYQGLNGFSSGNAGIREATAAVAAKPFLIQFGLDAKDSGGNWAAVPYELLMTEAQNKAIGTMFWQWKDPGANDPNSLVTNQLDPNSLTALGNVVINTHPASIKKTSKLVTPPGTVPPPSPPPGRLTYTSNTDVAINDNSTSTSSITVAGRNGNAPSNASVSVRIVHTYIGDLKVDLLAPDGTSYNIHNRTGGSTDNIVKTVTVNLSSETLNGTWRLSVNDNARQDTGFIDSWSVTF